MHKNRIGELIKKYREFNSLSRPELAEKICVSRQLVYKWETGESEPSTVNFLKTVKLLRIPNDEVQSLLDDIATEDIEENLDTKGLMSFKIERMEKELAKMKYQLANA